MDYPFTMYDLRFPSPVSLKEIVLNKMVIELWRLEIQNHRNKGTLEELDFKRSISSSILHPYVPSLLLETIDEKIIQVGMSIKSWIYCYTTKQIFRSHVLSNFDDFVCDFDGLIHYEKTAKRMMLCDGISQIDKFKIACLCCFEDDIALLWPSVSSRLYLRDIDFNKNSMLFYWICRLRNQSYKIPDWSNLNPAVNHRISMFFFTSHWSSVEYLFKCFNPSTQQILESLPQKFYRYMIAKLNEEVLDEFLKTNKFALRRFLYHDKSLLFWMHVKHKVTVDNFVISINQILFDIDICESLPEIWINAPDHLKQPVMRDILRRNAFGLVSCRVDYTMPSRHIDFLVNVLSDASFQERSTFWNENWIALLKIMNTSKLHQLMAMCFENEDQIIKYKETVMSDFAKIREYCMDLLGKFSFKKLNEVVNFCFTGEQNIKNIQLRLLNENFYIHYFSFDKVASFNKFINDVHNDIDSATQYKKQFFSRPSFVNRLTFFIQEGDLHLVSEIVETMVPSEPVSKDLKKRVFLPAFQTCLTKGSYLKIHKSIDYQKFLRLCLENDDEIDGFKKMVPVDEIVQAAIRRELEIICRIPRSRRGESDPLPYHPKLVKFLKWYFVTPEAYENFLAKYGDDEDFVALITPTE